MIQFETEHKLRELLDDIPGVGENVKKFRVKSAIDKQQAMDIMSMHGVDAEEMLRNALNNETAMHLLKEMHHILSDLPSTTVTTKELVTLIKDEETVMVNVKVAAYLQDAELFMPVMSTHDKNKTIYKIGKIGKCSVYINTLIPFSDASAFVIRENVISLKNVSEGRIYDGRNESILIEGSFTTSNSTSNKHYKVNV